jgi:predicted phage terminase large subunit-like protein
MERVRFDALILSWDMTYKKTETGSWVVGQAWGRIGANKYLLDETRGRWDLEGTIEAMRAMKRRWPIAQEILVESKANGPRVISRLKNEIAGLVPITPEGDKEQRAQAQLFQFRGHNVWIPPRKGNEWVIKYLRELGQFPKGVYNDRVDATIQALEWLEAHGAVVLPTTRPRGTNWGQLRQY